VICTGELELLVRSIQIFWPRFLGKVVLVLDPPDVHTWHFVVPREDAHQWEVRFEHTPTMKARIFNQYSYLNLDRQSTADAIVTIDSDCLFFTPVTPSLLFRDGRLILPHSSVFQRGMWNKATEYFFPNASYFKWHTMVAQPVRVFLDGITLPSTASELLTAFSSMRSCSRCQVAFLRRTLPEYRQWQLARGTCLEARIAAYIIDFPSPPIPEQFCWMCQLGTFIDMASTHRDSYYLHDCDNPSAAPAMKYVVHWSYQWTDWDSFKMPRDGLCRAFGAAAFAECRGIDTSSVRNEAFDYSNWNFSAAPLDAKESVLKDYLALLRRAAATLSH
jgi:hypothetical protein